MEMHGARKDLRRGTVRKEEGEIRETSLLRTIRVSFEVGMHFIMRVISAAILSVLHNSDIWMVFDAAPRYLFHYAYSRGIVGIYLGPTPLFDFRSVLHDRNFKLASLDAMEYRITSSDTVAACGE
jgi:hypothetical protein